MQFQNLEPLEEDQLTSPKEIMNDEASAGSEDQGSPKANVRSYECVFCKRGFSNAQALGGHMNIHRKDRVKLKHPPSIRTRFPLDHVPARVASPKNPPAAFMAYASQKGFVFGDDGESHGEKIYADDGPQQLSLFMEGSSTRASSLGWQHGESGEPPNRDLAADLDLELRLGPEPPGMSTGLREFL